MVSLPEIRKTFNIHTSGTGTPTLVLAHGFGSDQTAWRHQSKVLGQAHRLVLFDYLGCGQSDISYYSPRLYNSLDRYAKDLLTILEALELREVVFVGHSVSAMIGMLASLAAPERFLKLVFVGASPRYLNDEGYFGGFETKDLENLYQAMADNYLAWANGFAPGVIANEGRPELGKEFTQSLGNMRPDIAQSAARVIFESDCRERLPEVKHPVLILQSSSDPIVPIQVGEYLSENIPNGQLVVIDAEGHMPHLCAPERVTAAIQNFLEA